MNAIWVSWAIAALATLGVITRPFRWPEAVWAVSGAALLVILGLLPANLAWHAVLKGSDVYLFLIGMMLLSEAGRREGLFDWVASIAVNHAKGSPRRLFLLVYAVGTVTTTFLSNDATAVVLTPAVFAAARKADMKPLPLLFICALIANAASFVLPISNPANLVLYGNHIPALGPWLMRFTLPSVAAILLTYFVLRWTQRDALRGRCAEDVAVTPLSGSARIALAGIALTAVVLMVVSALDQQLGLPTAVLGILTATAVCVRSRTSAWAMTKDISWGVLPLVAGLFVLVEMLSHTGVIAFLSDALVRATHSGEKSTGFLWSVMLAVATNLVNNLPAGLVASSTLMQAHSSNNIVDALLIGVDLGPNLSVTGSLATILWLSAIRREGENVSFFGFLKVGSLVMFPALLCALGVRLLFG